VSNYTIDPAVLFTGDTGTATFYVTNGNANESIVVNHATFGDKDIRISSGTYDTSANIGPLQTRSFVFSIITDEVENTYYPTFSLSFRDADSLYYRTPIQVDNTPLILSALTRPDTFTQGKKDSIVVQIANPRKNAVKNVILEVTGDGMTATPAKQFLGVLSANAAANFTFSITPDKESPVQITADYNNGDNTHNVSQILPVAFGIDKKQASPQMSNVEVKLESGIYHVTGDVTNAGLTTANGVTVRALSPAVPQDPYKSYVIGALKPDDFGSFEVTFTANGTRSIPLQVSYKDADGNVISSQHDISTSLATITSTKETGSGPGLLLPALAVIIVGLVAGGWYVYNKRLKKL
jgi:hypothetical protein